MTADQLEALTPGLSRVVARVHSFAKCCFCGNPLVLISSHWWCPTAPCRDIQRRYSICLRQESENGLTDIWWHVPLPKQAKVELQKAPNVMFAGAMGPGKSHWGRKRLTRRAIAYENYRGLIVRRQLVEVQSTHIEKLRHELKELSEFGIVSKLKPKYVEFPQTGGVIQFAHLSTDKALEALLGPEYDDILLDEASVIGKPEYLPKLMARARTVKPEIIADGGSKALPVTNPGGPSAGYLKDMFITHTPDYQTYPMLLGSYKPEDWVYIEATLDDNPYLDEAYEQRLRALDHVRYRQARYADWDVFEGMAFPDWRSSKDGQPWHVQPVTLA